MELNIESSRPLYSIGVAAEILGISARMLREYEKAGLIKPARIGGKRNYSNNDLHFIMNIKFYLEDVGMTITALKVFYLSAPCWQIKQCGQKNCPAYHNCDVKCWEVIKGHDSCDARTCKGCPIYLVYKNNKGLKIYEGKDVGPKCFRNT